MIQINQAIIVEGKYDKIKLSSIVDAVIIATNGFGIFKDKDKVELIRFYAKKRGIIILTDSDTAGFKIRGYIKSFVNSGEITNVYIPDIFGKEKRKVAPSKEGKLGVEGIDKDLLIDAFKRAGIFMQDSIQQNFRKIEKMDLYEDGLSGGKNSAELRRKFLKLNSLPELMTTNSLLDAINSMMTYGEYKEKVEQIK